MRSAVGEDRPAYALGGTPVELLADRNVTDARLAAAPDDRADDARAVADIEGETAHRLAQVPDRDHVGRVQDRRAAGRGAVGDRGRPQRVLDWERLQLDAVEGEPFSRLDRLALRDR